MRAVIDDSTRPAGTATPTSDIHPSRRANDFVVAPILVNDLMTQCAAHFMAWFTTNSAEHIADVMQCGREPGGLHDEVEHWFYECDQDVDPKGDNSMCYWPVEDKGPWLYEGLDPVEVAEIVHAHTAGWSTEEFSMYGFTVEDMDNLEEAKAQFAANLEQFFG